MNNIAKKMINGLLNLLFVIVAIAILIAAMFAFVSIQGHTIAMGAIVVLCYVVLGTMVKTCKL